MKNNLIIFLTHHFNDIFLNTLIRINNTYTDSDIIVLFDNNKTYDISINILLKNITIYKVNLINTSYDRLGHSMYINFFREKKELLNQYNYYWIIENDVYFPNNLKTFIDKHKIYNYDLLVPEYGCRDVSWGWIQSLNGFTKTYNIGVLAVIMRLSLKLMNILINSIDSIYSGYIEAILPHICIENNLSIHQFLPELCGILTTDNNNKLIKLIKQDIINNTTYLIENKIYHPIK